MPNSGYVYFDEARQKFIFSVQKADFFVIQIAIIFATKVGHLADFSLV